jgi:hypothetical protein
MRMKMSRKGLAVTLAGAALTVGMSAAPAAAYPDYTMICDTPDGGARGVLVVNDWYVGKTDVKVSIAVGDNLADHHHVSVRVLGKNDGGGLITWPWHQNYDGNGSSKSWGSTASYSAGLYDMGVQAAVYEGDRQVSSCTDWINKE